MEFIGQIIGYLAMAIGFFALTLKDDLWLRKVALLATCLMIPHYFLIGSPSSALVVALIGLRIWCSYRYKNDYVYYGFLGLSCVQILGMVWYQVAWFDYFPAVACLFSTYIYFRLEGIAMRVAFIIACLFWVIGCWAMASYPGLISNAVGIGLHLITITRLLRDRAVLCSTSNQKSL